MKAFTNANPKTVAQALTFIADAQNETVAKRRSGP